MIRYRHDSDNPEKPIIEATPTDIDQLRGFVHAYLRRKFPKFGLDGIEDAAQVALIAACRAVSQGALRGHYGRTPESTLRGWLAEAARRIARNVERSASYRASLVCVSAEYFDGADGRSPPDVLIDAQKMLALIAGDRRTVSVILLLADGATHCQVAEQIGVSRSTITKRIMRIRERLTVFRDRGPWDEPNQPPPRSPRDRKRKR